MKMETYNINAPINAKVWTIKPQTMAYTIQVKNPKIVIIRGVV